MMALGWRISRVSEVVGAFFGGEFSEDFADRCANGFDRSGGGSA
jgi:hypothetical protein